jgi:hypothetical protein
MMQWMRLGALVVVALFMPALQACYTYGPLTTPAPAVGETFEFEISDRGRVDLGERFGPGLKEIEGRLVSNENSQFVINVFRVSHVNGQSAQWSGEASRISRDYVSTVRGRQLSRGRTALAAAGATAAVVAILASRGLLATFTGESDKPGDDEPPISTRIPLIPVIRW